MDACTKKSGLRQLGSSDLWVSPVSLGCWPMSGVSSLDVDDDQSLATIEAALEAGINHFDTAYSYGYDGRADRILHSALSHRWDSVVLSSKVGSHYTAARVRILDASPQRLRQEADEIRLRLRIDCIDILYLHAPDGVTPIETSAEALADLQQRGACRNIGLSNATPSETIRFASVVEPIVVQPPFNMLQQNHVNALRPFCIEHRCGIAGYWPLMKGLLAGKLNRDHRFDDSDRRLSYPMFTGIEWQKNQDFLDKLRSIALQLGWSVARLVVRWTMDQPGITTVLCGAKRPDQIVESAESMTSPLPHEVLQAIDTAILCRNASYE